ncbi:MAG: 5'-nucleotidase, lipoprotein e(P4) family [Pyrinomonadaceae bacterium]
MTAKKYVLSLAFALGTIASISLTPGSFAQTSQPALAPSLEYQLASVLYMQKSAEYRALCFQAFNVAHMRLDADLDKKNNKKLSKAERKMPRAIVVDIDETVLDNSPAQARGIKTNSPYNSKDWYAWSNMRKAKAVPGSVEFLNYAVSKGVKIFYISNRDEQNEKQATLENLKSVGFRDISSDNVMLRTTESTKEGRRKLVSDRYRIVILVGDNLDDFSEVFEKKPIADRFAVTVQMRESWGRNFIVLPNAMYGTWENAIYEYQRLTEAQKAEKRAAALELP